MAKHGGRIIATLAVLSACLVFMTPQAGNSTPYGQVTGMGLGASPNNWNGACPVTINFNGWIRTDGPNTVIYGITRSDGGRGSGPQTLHFTRAESLKVHFTWRLGKPGENYNGWAEIGSGTVRSNRAEFHLHCRR
jgi:hypothetical protein